MRVRCRLACHLACHLACAVADADIGPVAAIGKACRPFGGWNAGWKIGVKCLDHNDGQHLAWHSPQAGVAAGRRRRKARAPMLCQGAVHEALRKPSTFFGTGVMQEPRTWSSLWAPTRSSLWAPSRYVTTQLTSDYGTPLSPRVCVSSHNYFCPGQFGPLTSCHWRSQVYR